MHRGGEEPHSSHGSGGLYKYLSERIGEKMRECGQKKKKKKKN